jgi:6-phosphofructokinase 1
VALRLHGSKGFLSSLVRKVLSKGYATIALAEGTGQDLFPRRKEERDASGNVKLQNIGDFLQQEIKTEFKNRHMEITLKYIDPSYMVRAQTTSADDSVFCSDLGQHAAHAAMAGKTGCMIGYAHERFTHVPLSAVAMGKKQMQTQSPLWVSVLAATGQPAQWGEISV